MKRSDKLKLTVALSALALWVGAEMKRRRRRRNRTEWVKSRLLQRQTRGVSPNMSQELESNETSDLRNFAWLFPKQFHELQELVSPLIQRQNTNYRDCISAGERLRITLRFMATGESFKSLSYRFRVGVSTIRQLIPETCAAIGQVLKEKYMKCPDTEDEWQQVADGFQAQWNFPHCLGALEAKHINICPTPGNRPTLKSYKHTFPVVLLALVDSGCRFLCVDVGCQDLVTDGVVFGGRSLKDVLEDRTSNIPAPAPLPGSHQRAPYCIVGDKAFPLKPYLMKPYSNSRLSVGQRLFNYRLSRARGAVENALGVLANRFRVLLAPINVQDPAKAEDIVVACCALHNFLWAESRERYMAGVADREGPDRQTVPGRWRRDPVLRQASLSRSTNATTRAKRQRDELCRYFVSDDGAVPFQWNKV